MDCKAFRTVMEELEMGESLSGAAQAHVDSCAACRTFQHERLSLRRLVGSLGSVSAPPDFDFRLRARLAAARSAGNGSFRRARFAPPSLKAISVAASFVLLIAAGIAFKQFQLGQVNPPAASGNPTVAAGSDVKAQQPENISGQVAATSTNGKASAADSASSVSTPGGIVQAIDNTPKSTPARAARNAFQMKERSPILSSESAVLGNPPVITRVGPPAANGFDERYGTALLQVSSQPVKMLLHDKEGTTRSVSLNPVIFGSQDFLEKSAQRRSPSVDVEGIW